MSYRIQYNPELNRKYSKQKNSTHIPSRHIIILVVMFISAYIFAHNGWFKYLLPGDPDVTSSALETLVERVEDGNPVKDAVYCFCEDIITGSIK